MRHVPARPAGRTLLRATAAVAEHLACRCGRCGYRWQRRALDPVDLTMGPVTAESAQEEIDAVYTGLVEALTPSTVAGIPQPWRR